MSLDVDASALPKHYVDEPDRERFEALYASDPVHLTGRHTIVEVRRTLARLLAPDDAAAMRRAIGRDVRIRSASPSPAPDGRRVSPRDPPR